MKKIIAILCMLTCFAGTLLAQVNSNGSVYYVRDANPWGQDQLSLLNSAFGSGGYTVATYSTAAATLFSNNVAVVYLEGSDGTNPTSLLNYLNANRSAIETWVSNGGRLFLNAGPNQGGNINFGFGGVTLVYTSYSSTGSIVSGQSGHAIFNTAGFATGSSWTGGYFAHASISGSGFTPLISGETGTILAEKRSGSGVVLFGGMTTTNFHSPQPGATNLRVSILKYLRGVTLAQPLSATVSSNNSTCFGSNNGKIFITAGGGTAPYQYSINNGTTYLSASSFTGLAGGTYSVRVKDAAGSVTTAQSVTITEPARIVPAIVASAEMACPNTTATLTASGATTYSWSNGAAGSSITVSAGTYSVTGTVNGCTSAPVSVTIQADSQAPVANNTTLPTITGSCSASATAPTATDNCAGTVTATTTDPTSYTTQGTYTIHWVYTDGNGNSSTQEQTVIVKDVTPPVIACAFNVTVNADFNSCAAVVNYNAPSATDNCGNGTLPTSLDGYTYKGTFGGHAYFLSNDATNPEDAHARAIALGGHLVTIGNAEENAFVSAMSPSFIWIGHTDREEEGNFKWVTSEPVSYTNWNGGEPNNYGGNEDWAVINWGPNGTWNDWLYTENALFVVEFEGGNIPTQLVSGLGSGAAFPIGTTTETWKAVDAGGNVATCSFTVTVVDSQAPSIVGLPANITVGNDANVCGAQVSWSEPASADNCSNHSISRIAGPAPGSVFPVGSTTVTYRAQDAAGLTTISGFTVTVIDNEAPHPLVANLPVINAECATVLTAPKAMDNCVGTVTATTTDATTFTAQGTYTVRWKYSDGNGNTSEQLQTVNIKDVTAPTIANCPGNITVSNEAGKCGAKVNFSVGELPPVVDQQRTDIFIGTIGNDQWQGFTAGKTGRLTGIDLFHNGCQTTSYTLTVYSGTGTGGAVLYSGFYNAGVSCSGWYGNPIPAGSQPMLVEGQKYTFRLQGTNLGFVAGGTTTPVPYYSSSYGLNPSSRGQYWSLDFKTYVSAGSPSASATDNCGVASFGSDHQSGDEFPVGTTLVTYTAIDIAGNRATCTFNVTVTDTEKPAITAPANLTIATDAGACSATQVALGTPANSDNCAVANVRNNAPVAYPVGTTLVTWTATDIHGNVQTAVQTVQVQDLEAPVVHTNSFTIQLDASGAASITKEAVNNASTDNCGIASISIDKTSFDCSNVGANTVTLTVTDIHGNVSTGTAIITVEDKVAPVITCPGAITLNCQDNNGTDITGVATATDACGIATIAHSDASTQSADINSAAHYNYTITRTWTATDVSGNSSQCVQVLTVQDITAPSVTTEAGSLDRTAECSDATAIADAMALAPAASDICAPVTMHLASDVTTNGCGSTYTRVRTWNFTDVTGNTSGLFTQTLTVADRTAPVISTTPAYTEHCFDTTGNTYGVAQLQATDNCTDVAYSYTVTGPDGTTLRSGNTNDATGSFGVGLNTINWMVKDACGNTTTAATVVRLNARLNGSFNSFTLSGGRPNTIYTSTYAPAASATVKVTVTGGTAPYTYQWSQSGTAAGFTASSSDGSVITTNALSSGSVTYTVVVTDSKGCQAKFVKTVQVVDVRCGNKEDKVLVCHNTGSGSNPWVQVCVAPAAVATQLANGGYLGTCNSNAVTRQQPKVEPTLAPSLNAYPNPSRGIVQLRVSGLQGKLRVEVLDSRGSRLLQRDQNVSFQSEDLTLDLQTAAAGLYTVRVTDGKTVLTTRIVIAR